MTGYALGAPTSVTWGLTGGCLAGVLLTPDLDVDNPVHSHAIVDRRIGCLPGLIWRVLWYPYAKSIPHRHWLSHAPIIGTLLRVMYIALPTWAVLTLLGYPKIWLYLPDCWLGVLIGLAVSDALHWAADMGISQTKRFFRRIFKRRRRRR
jgi:uncharacterized metal-binding protein